MALRSMWKANKEEVVAPNGMVNARLPQSGEAGLAMLKAGGNAVDAAVAMGFCSVVLEPYNAAIGGMGCMLVHLAAEGRTIGVDFNARAPQRATGGQAAHVVEILGAITQSIKQGGPVEITSSFTPPAPMEWAQ